MLNVGGPELLIILLVALVFLGPQRLPELARQMGQAVSSLRSLASGFQAELEAASRPDPDTSMTLKGPTTQSDALAQTQPGGARSEADMKPQSDRSQGAVSQDGAAQDGVAPDGTSPDGAAQNGVAPDGASSNGAAQDGAAQDGAAQDGAAQDGAAQDGVSRDGAAQDGAVQDGASSADPVADSTKGTNPASIAKAARDVKYDNEAPVWSGGPTNLAEMAAVGRGESTSPRTGSGDAVTADDSHDAADASEDTAEKSGDGE